MRRATCLLIEPFGIEMNQAEGFLFFFFHLLIEPFGIEIVHQLQAVPYGASAFNRTFWN